jgi:hypothetical protein
MHRYLKTCVLGLISVLTLLAISCTDESKQGSSGSESWSPSLSEGERLLRIVRLAPAEVLPIEGVIESPGIYGIRIKEAWDIKDRADADGGDYWVYLRSPSSTPDRPNSVGTTYGASTKFNPGDGIKYEVANETPIPVTVAIYTEN